MNQRTALFTALVVALSATVASAATTMDVYVSLGPHSTSDSFDQFGENAVTGLQNGGTATGTPGTPEYWNPVTEVTTRQQVRSGDFNSWKAEASPDAPFDNEYGTLPRWSVAIESDVDFRMWDLEWGFSSSDFNGNYDSLSGSLDGDNFTSWLVGINADGDVFDDGESGDEFIRKLYYAGVGIGTSPDSSWTGTNQELLNQTVEALNADLGENSTITGEYVQTLDGGFPLANTATISVSAAPPVPEPATLTLIGLGSAVLLSRRR
ncbi:MAG: PEP-CTERM sorting domain-containing protein [Candidatus Paceibacterota bacterium]